MPVQAAAGTRRETETTYSDTKPAAAAHVTEIECQEVSDTQSARTPGARASTSTAAAAASLVYPRTFKFLQQSGHRYGRRAGGGQAHGICEANVRLRCGTGMPGPCVCLLHRVHACMPTVCAWHACTMHRTLHHTGPAQPQPRAESATARGPRAGTLASKTHENRRVCRACAQPGLHVEDEPASPSRAGTQCQWHAASAAMQHDALSHAQRGRPTALATVRTIMHPPSARRPATHARGTHRAACRRRQRADRTMRHQSDALQWWV